MKTHLLGSCAAIAVLALTLTAVQAQQPVPEQRPAAGAAGDTNTTTEKTRRGGDAATSRPAPSRSSEQPAAGQDRGAAADDTKKRPSQAQSPSQDRPSAGGRDRANRATQQNAREGRDGERSQRSTRSRDRDDMRRSAGERMRDGRDRRDAEIEGTNVETRGTAGTRQDSRGMAGERQETRGAASISQDQRASERFSARIDSDNVRPLSRTNISVTIGATVPRSVRMYDVPRDVIAIYPRYRGHRFVVVEDEIVIIEPRSRRIVATMPRAGGGQAAAATSTRSSAQTTGARPGRLHLSDSQRQVIRTTIMREPRCRLETRVDFVLLVPLPRTVEVCDFPAEIVSEVPDVRPYRFVVRGEEIAIVDPADHQVIDVIE